MSNNWAVLVDTSAFWFNYRHYSNVMSVYQSIRASGIPDERIILMLAEDIACNARNIFPGLVANNDRERFNLLSKDVQVDYRGPEVSVENIIRLFTNRLPEGTPLNKRLLSDENSNILVFMTGHGGENFLKFRNVDEITAHDLAESFAQMWSEKRYKQMLFIIDTCQAESMFSKFYSPEIFSISSSKVGESSYSYTVDTEVGLSIIDRFTHQLVEFLQARQPDTTLQQLIDHFDSSFLSSTTVTRSDLFSRPTTDIFLSEFFSGKQESSQIGKYPIEGIKDFQWTPTQKSEKVTKAFSQQSFTIAQEQFPTPFWHTLLFTMSITVLFFKVKLLSKPNEKVRK